MLAFSDIPMSPRTMAWRYIALISHLLLIVWVATWRFYFDQEQIYSSTFIIAFYITPLLLPITGVIKAKPYTHAWASFIVLIYLTHSLTVVYAVPVERLLAIIELILASTMFIGCCMFARFRGKECGLKLGKLKDVMEKEKSYFEDE